MTDLVYRTSSRCTTGGCVEVAPLSNGYVDKQEWADFVAGVKNGDFDFSEEKTSG